MRRASGAMVAALLLVLVLVPGTSAKTVRVSWTASIGTFGTATLYAYADGTGGLGLRLARLTHDARYAVGLYRGTCAKPTRWLAFPAATASGAGEIRRGYTLSAARLALARAYVKTGLVARIGSKCGSFSLSVGTATPSPGTSATPSPGISASPVPTRNACAEGVACLGSMTTISLPSGASGSVGPFSMSWVSSSSGAVVTVRLRGDLVLTEGDVTYLSPLLAASPAVAGAIAADAVTWDNATGNGTLTFTVPLGMASQPMWLSLQGNGGRLWWSLVEP